MTTLAVVVVGAILAPVARPMSREPVARPTTYANPAIDEASGNPFVLEWGQVAYAYVDGRPATGENVPAYATGDLATWHPVGEVLPEDRFGAWMAGGITAPAVAAYPDNPAGSRFVLWFAATSGVTRQRCLGVATAGTPGGPFTAADEPLLCPSGGADVGDPSPVAASGGPAQLLFRQEGDRSGIYALPLTSDGQAAGGAEPALLLLDGGGAAVGRPALVRAGDGDRALLLFTSATADGVRSIGWARCELAEGQLAGAGGDVAGCSAVPGGRQWVVGDETAVNPGAPQVFGEPGDQWLAYDAFAPGACTSTGCTGHRRFHLAELCLDGAGAATGAGGGATEGRAGAGAASDGTGDGGVGGGSQAAGRAVAGPVTVPRTGAGNGGPGELERARSCREDVPDGWVATWAAGTMPASSQFAELRDGFADQTLRQVVHTSVGGGAVRIRLSNTFGTAPLHVGRASVGLAAEPMGATPAVPPDTRRPLTFGGRTGVVVPPGGDVLSDAVALDVPADHDLAVSLWFPRPTGLPSGHLVALETSYVGPGDLVDDPGLGFTGAGATTTTSSFFVSAVDVLVGEPAGTVVLLGDSLTDGAGSAVDVERRWSDYVADRLAAEGPLRQGVVNVGIAGNPLLPNARSTSPSGLERFDHDVLAQADVATVVVLLGTNDLLGGGASGADVIDGLRRLVDRAHAAGVRVVGVTIPPFAGPAEALPPDAVERSRTEINERIRAGVAGGLGFDAVVDMDAAVADPRDPRRLRGDFGWFGGFHPSEAGHRAMADAIDLDVLVPG